jgi:hypothetical protein
LRNTQNRTITSGSDVTEFWVHQGDHVRAYQDPKYHPLLINFFERYLSQLNATELQPLLPGTDVISPDNITTPA